MPSPRVALVHDWLVSPGGGEKVLQAFHELWPEAPIYTAAYEPAKFPEFKNADVRTTWLNRIGLARRKHQLFALPRIVAFKQLDLSDYDIVISSSTAEGKGVSTGKALHLCYCHTPTRYYWSDYQWYLNHPPFGRLLRPFASLGLMILAPILRRIDYGMAQQVDVFIANSDYVRQRIRRYYRRDAKVIHPPVSADRFKPDKVGDYFLVVGRQVAYKRLDLAVEAFNRLGLPLVVAGEGEEVKLQQPHSRSNIQYLGRVSDAKLTKLYAQARAIIYPQTEDFGIVPLEAMASGRPVIAFGEGGALETVVDGETGIFFSEQTAEALVEAVQRFEGLDFDAEKIRQHALTFDQAVFKQKIKQLVEAEWSRFER